MRLMLCLPVAPHDIGMAMDLARLWVDIDETKKDIDVFIALRFDMSPSDIPADMVDLLKTRFANVYIQKSKLEGTGWPAGCNAHEVGAYEVFVENNRNGKFNAEYMLICESDTVPLRPTWLAEISKEAFDSGALVIGAYYTKADGCAHINGNGVWHKDLWKDCKEIWEVPPHTAWDFYIGRKTLSIGKPSRLIWQEYRLGTEAHPWKGDDNLWVGKNHHAADNPLYGETIYPAMFHGCKTYQAIDAVRKRYNLKPRDL